MAVFIDRVLRFLGRRYLALADAELQAEEAVESQRPAETRLAPLYDLVCTVYYPELSRDMAMKIGGEYRSERVTAAHFEQLAEEAGFAKPLVRQRVAEVAERVIAGLTKMDLTEAVAEKVAAIIRQRAERSLLARPQRAR